MSDVELNFSLEFKRALAKEMAPLLLEELKAESNTIRLNGWILLDQFVEQCLPKTKPHETWKGWIYDQLARADRTTLEEMGASKMGGHWHFNPAKATEWFSTRW